MYTFKVVYNIFYVRENEFINWKYWLGKYLFYIPVTDTYRLILLYFLNLSL